MELYDWQSEALDALREHDFNGVIKVASGKGKTVLAIAAIKEVLDENPGKALVVVPTINLMHQWAKEIEKFMPGKKISFNYGAEKSESGDIIISVINTASKLGFVNSFEIKVLDEIHHYGAELYQGIFSIKTKHTIGLSATPEREDEGDLAIRYGAGKIVYYLHNIDELRERFKMFTVRVPLSLNEYTRYMDFQNEYYKILAMAALDPRMVESAAKRGNKFALRILKIWTEQAKIRHKCESKIRAIKAIKKNEADQKIIIFSESIEFSETLGVELDAIVVHSKLGKKEVLKRLEDFRDIKSGILIAPRMIDEGYDVPDATVAIVASFTRSPRQMIQRDGRVLRRKDFVRRYTLVIEAVEEEKFFGITRKTNMTDIANDGMWLFYDNQFVEDDNFKKEFKKFLENGDDYEEWIIKRLDFACRAEQLDMNFFNAHRLTIERLAVENPGRWSILKPTEVSKKIKIGTSYKEDEQREIKNELRKMNSLLFMPDKLFNGVMRFLEGEEFEMDDEAREYLSKLVSQDRTDFWPEKLFGVMKMFNKLL